jgi:hypothetical protein
MITAIIPILLSILVSIALSWVYFLRVAIKRPPIGVMNLWDVAFVIAGILIIPYLYLHLPLWIVTALLALLTASIIYFVLEPVVRVKIALWLLALSLTLAVIATAVTFGANSRAFYVINNLVLVLIVIGVSNIWVQSGMRARDATVLAIFLMIYDFIFTSLLPVTNDLFVSLSALPFAPMFVWSFRDEGQWLAIGLGDVLLVSVFPFVLDKAFGRSAGWMAAIVAMGIIVILLVSPNIGLLRETIPVMVVIGPLMFLQYSFWHRQLGAERTMRQYLQSTKPDH